MNSGCRRGRTRDRRPAPRGFDRSGRHFGFRTTGVPDRQPGVVLTDKDKERRAEGILVELVDWRLQDASASVRAFS